MGRPPSPTGHQLRVGQVRRWRIEEWLTRDRHCLSVPDLVGGQLGVEDQQPRVGTEYEIDLSAEHAQALRDALARYVRAA